MIVRDVLVPTGLNLSALATAIGEYPNVLEAVIRGHWHADLNPHLKGYWTEMGHKAYQTHVFMLPRIATRLVEISKYLERRGAVPHTYEEWMGREVAEYLSPAMFVDHLVRPEDVVDGEGDADPDAWLRGRNYFQLRAFKKACPSCRTPEFKSHLWSRGYEYAQKLVGGNPVNTWYWNPRDFRMPNHRFLITTRAPLDAVVPVGISKSTKTDKYG